MALYELARTLNGVIKVENGVAGADIYRFVDWVAGATEPYEFATFVPGAAGGVPAGICAQKPDPNGVKQFLTSTGYVNSQLAIPEGGQCLILCAEICAVGDWLRAGGNGGETDGAAYLANATNDVRIARALEVGAVGQIIAIQYVGYSGLTP
jgi:hypothetical protein